MVAGAVVVEFEDALPDALSVTGWKSRGKTSCGSNDRFEYAALPLAAVPDGTSVTFVAARRVAQR